MEANLKGRWRRMLLTTVVPMVLLFCFFYAYSSDYTDGMASAAGVPAEGAEVRVVVDEEGNGRVLKPQQQTPEETPVAVVSAAPNGGAKGNQNVAPPAQHSSVPHTETKPHPVAHTTTSAAAASEHSATPSAAAEKEDEDDDLSMEKVIKALYRPVLHPIDAANFTDEEGKIHHLPGEAQFKEKLGKRVLILDIDSRPLDGEGQLLDPNLKWRGMRPLSAGMLSHYMFGKSPSLIPSDIAVYP